MAFGQFGEVEKMKKDKEWLKKKFDEVIEFRKESNPSSSWGMGSNTVLKHIKEDFKNLIDQLDETEVKQLDKKIKELDSYNDELIRDNNQLRNELDNQEVLSQKWIEEHKYNHYIGKPFVYVDDLQNLIVPKQDKPVIPQFVADYIESQDDPIYEMCINYEMWGVNGDDGTTSFTREIAEWFDDTLNVENYYRACIDGYEVEKEKRYQVKIPVTVWDYDASELKEHTSFLAYDITSDETRILSTTRCSGDYRTDLTETQIKAIDKRYWAFAEEVTE